MTWIRSCWRTLNCYPMRFIIILSEGSSVNTTNLLLLLRWVSTLKLHFSAATCLWHLGSRSTPYFCFTSFHVSPLQSFENFFHLLLIKVYVCSEMLDGLYSFHQSLFLGFFVTQTPSLWIRILLSSFGFHEWNTSLLFLQSLCGRWSAQQTLSQRYSKSSCACFRDFSKPVWCDWILKLNQ